MFDFLELDNQDIKEKTYYQIEREIPNGQKIIYSDLTTISPEKEVLSLLLPQILKKYTIIPLFISRGNSQPLLPKHLDKEYWGTIEGDKISSTLYIACLKPYDIQILNILKNITKYSIVSIPLEEQDGLRFIDELFSPKIETKEKFSIFKYSKEHFIYIFVFALLISGLLSLKIYL